MRKVILAALILSVTVSAQEKLDVGLQLDVVLRNPDVKDYTNLTFRGHSNFHTVRTRVIFNAYVNDYISINAQLLSDNSSSPYVFSAYAHWSHPTLTYLNLNVGIIPIPVGLFGANTYSDKNPVIGVPLIYVHHTNINIYDPQITNSELLSQRGKGFNLGGYGGQGVSGIPFLYDACWNSGVNLFGSYGPLDYSLAALFGSLSRPLIQIEDRIPQITAQVAVTPVAGIRAGLLGGWGPYLALIAEEDFPLGKDVNDYKQILGGVLSEISYGHFDSQGEFIVSAYEHPFLGYLKGNGFYTLLKYKILTGVYAAVRWEQMNFGKIEDETNPGSRHTWDYNVRRAEAAIGYYLDRNVLLKLDTQINRFPGQSSLNDDIYALQLSLSL